MANVDWGSLLMGLGKGVVQGIQLRQQQEELDLKKKAAEENKIKLLAEMSKNIVSVEKPAVAAQPAVMPTPEVTSTTFMPQMQPESAPRPLGMKPQLVPPPPSYKTTKVTELATPGKPAIPATPAVPAQSISMGTAKDIYEKKVGMEGFEYKEPAFIPAEQITYKEDKKGDMVIISRKMIKTNDGATKYVKIGTEPTERESTGRNNKTTENVNAAISMLQKGKITSAEDPALKQGKVRFIDNQDDAIAAVRGGRLKIDPTQVQQFIDVFPTKADWEKKVNEKQSKVFGVGIETRAHAEKQAREENMKTISDQIANMSKVSGKTTTTTQTTNTVPTETSPEGIKLINDNLEARPGKTREQIVAALKSQGYLR